MKSNMPPGACGAVFLVFMPLCIFGDNRMKRLLTALTVAAPLVLATSGPAAANESLFILDCTITSATVCTSGGPFGSVLLQDNGNYIDVTVTLLNSSLGVGAVSLNWLKTGTSVPTAGTWSIVGGNIGSSASDYAITVSDNNDGPSGRFDIRIRDTGTVPLGTLGNPLTFTLANSVVTNLDVSYFTTRDDVNQLFAGVLGTLSAGESSEVRYGAKTTPEPAIIALLGIGVAALGFADIAASRRRKK